MLNAHVVIQPKAKSIRDIFSTEYKLNALEIEFLKLSDIRIACHFEDK